MEAVQGAWEAFSGLHWGFQAIICAVSALVGLAILNAATAPKAFSLVGCHVVVTGGSSGIGKACAQVRGCASL